MKEEIIRKIIREEIGALFSISGDNKLLTDSEVAEKLGVHKGTLANWRVKGIGPDHIKVSGNRPKYTLSAVSIWLSERSVKGG